MAATGSHPALKLKKHIHLALDPNRRPSQSNPPSQPDSTNTLNPDSASNSGAVTGGRRKSTYKTNAAGLVAATLNIRRMTRASIPNQVPTHTSPGSLALEPVMPKMNVRYENTYKMEPEAGSKFKHSMIEAHIYKLLEEQVKDVTYDPATSAQLTQTIADTVKSTVKPLFSPRYKLVTSVLVGQSQQQGLEASSRCLWDEAKDNFASVVYRNKSLFVMVLIFGCYFE